MGMRAELCVWRAALSLLIPQRAHPGLDSGATPSLARSSQTQRSALGIDVLAGRLAQVSCEVQAAVGHWFVGWAFMPTQLRYQ